MSVKDNVSRVAGARDMVECVHEDIKDRAIKFRGL
jgi:hypothetical protein